MADTDAGVREGGGGVSGGEEREEEPMAAAECRVCRAGVEAGMLYYPCRCKGSIRYVHEDCLMEWLSYSNKSSCEVCNAEFRFRPIYKGDMPSTLGNMEMLYGSLELFLGQTPTFLRYTAVTVIWLALPYLVERMHTLFYSTSAAQAYHTLQLTFLQLLTDPAAVFASCLQGLLLELLIVINFLGIMTLQEQVMRQERIHRDTHRAPIEVRAAAEEEEEEVVVERAEEEVPEARANFGGLEMEQMPEMLNNFQHDGRVDELLGLGDAGLLQGLKNMLFVTLANAVFLFFFQLLPFSLGRAIATVLPPISLDTTQPLVCTFVGYVAAVGCVGLYLIATYLFRLQNKQHIRYLKQWSVHVLAAIFDVGKLLVISCVEFVLIEPVIGVVAHAASLGVFKDSLAKDRIKMCTDMPKTCLGIHWLVGTLLMSVISILVLSLRRVIRPRWMNLVSDWVLQKPRLRWVDATRWTGEEAPLPPSVEEHWEHVDAALAVRDVVLSKSLKECLSYTISVILFSMPLAGLLLYIPIQILNACTSTFPLVLEHVQVNVDIFLMHTAVPYILDSVELVPVFTAFLQMLVVGLAYPLDLHGLLMTWRNYFSLDQESDFIRVTDDAVLIAEPCSPSEGSEVDLQEYRCEGFRFLVHRPSYTRVDVTCVVCGFMPWSSLRKVFQECEKGVDPYFSSLNPTPVFAVADGHGYAFPVFLSISSLKRGVPRAVGRMLFTTDFEDMGEIQVHEEVEVEHVVRGAIDAFLVELALFKGRDHAAEISRHLSLEAPAVSLLRQLLFRLTPEEARALMSKMPAGFGERESLPTQNILMARRMASLFLEGEKENVFLVSFKDAVVSSCRGRSLVLDRHSRVCVQPLSRTDEVQQLQHKWLERRFKERHGVPGHFGQFWILQYQPDFLGIRMFVFTIACLVCAVLLLTLVMYIPLTLGRRAFLLCMIPFEHDLYHWTAGCIMVWGTLRVVIWGFRRIVRDRSVVSMLRGCIRWIQTMISNLVCVFVMFIVIPVTCGVLFELSVLHPIYYPIDKTPVVSTFGNWAGGLFLIKMWSRCVELGVFGETEWVRKVESLQNIRGIDRIWLLREVAVPVLSQLCLRLSLPYFVAKLLGSCCCDEYTAEALLRYIFPVFAVGFLLNDTINLLFIWLGKLHDRIRDQRYLVGRRLENFMQHRFNAAQDFRKPFPRLE